MVGLLHSVKYIKIYLNVHKALGHFNSTDCSMAVYPAHHIQHLCLCVLAISLARCPSLLDAVAAMGKNREKEQQDIVWFWSVCQQLQNVVFSVLGFLLAFISLGRA